MGQPGEFGVQLGGLTLNPDLGLGEPVRWCPLDSVAGVAALPFGCPLAGFAAESYNLDEVMA